MSAAKVFGFFGRGPSAPSFGSEDAGNSRKSPRHAASHPRASRDTIEQGRTRAGQRSSGSLAQGAAMLALCASLIPNRPRRRPDESNHRHLECNARALARDSAAARASCVRCVGPHAYIANSSAMRATDGWYALLLLFKYCRYASPAMPSDHRHRVFASACGCSLALGCASASGGTFERGYADWPFATSCLLRPRSNLRG